MLQDKILPRQNVEELFRSLRHEGKKIVFTNGCFDIMHAGHALYLEQAKGLGDVLVVGVNSDASIRRLKGPKRPIICEEQRLTMVAALESVNFVCQFEEDTPYELICDIKPDVLVKGGDWQVSEIVGADIVLANGGTVESLRFLNGISTTEIISRILEQS